MKRGDLIRIRNPWNKQNFIQFSVCKSQDNSMITHESANIPVGTVAEIVSVTGYSMVIWLPVEQVYGFTNTGPMWFDIIKQ